MKASLPIGRLVGIPIKVHVTFFLLMTWVVVAQARSGGSVAVGVQWGIFVLALFGCVVLHELGHALTARRYGVETKDIVLLPIGGVARLDRMPEEPRQELLVALAGPAVNVAIAAGLYGTLAAMRQPLLPAEIDGESFFVQRLALVNVVLVVFNMAPAFPMDGGRVLRALLSMQWGRLRATQIAAALGQTLAVLFGLIGLFVNPLLILIALFVWVGATYENQDVEMKEQLAEIAVDQLMLTEFRTLSPWDPLARAVELTLATSQRDFPVAEPSSESLVGTLTHRRLLKTLADGTPQEALVGDFMEDPPPTARVGEAATPHVDRMARRHASMVAVLHGSRLAGLLTEENLAEYLAFEKATGVRAVTQSPS